MLPNDVRLLAHVEIGVYLDGLASPIDPDVWRIAELLPSPILRPIM